MLRVCADEYQLFREFFTLCEDEVRDYIELISSLLSNQLRPLILRETRLDILSDLCNSLLFHLKAGEGSSEATVGESASVAPISQSTQGVDAVKFIVESILFDAQSRLAYRTQEFIQSEIRQFKPREKELMVLARGPDLPQPVAVTSTTTVTDILSEPSPILPRRRSSVAMSPTAEAAFIQPGTSEDAVASTVAPSAFGGGEWYPTLQRTVNLLSKIHSSLPVRVITFFILITNRTLYLKCRIPALWILRKTL